MQQAYTQILSITLVTFLAFLCSLLIYLKMRPY